MRLTFIILVWILSSRDFSHLGFQLFDHVLKFLCKKDQLRLIGDFKYIVVWLERLVQLVETCHLAGELLRRSEKLGLSFVLQQSWFVLVEMSISCLATILDKIKHRIQMVDLV